MTPSVPGPALVQVAPGPGGVADYMHCVEREWQARGSSSAALMFAEPSGDADTLGAQLARQGVAAPQPLALVVHFSGYGYGRRGLCFWLLDELARVRAEWGASLTLTVVFHETFAFGPPWRTAFWLSKPQEYIARRLARMADVLWTNTERHARWLRGVVGQARALAVWPVFSNVGEPDSLPPCADRAPDAVVFGSAPTRQRTLDTLAPLSAALHRLGIGAIVEAGEGPASIVPPGLPPIRHLGRLESMEVSRLLAATRFGLIEHAPSGLAKSGVFAAYAAHGCVVVRAGTGPGVHDGLVPGRHFLLAPSVAAGAEPAAVGTALAEWYRPHRLALQAAELFEVATGRRRDGPARG